MLHAASVVAPESKAEGVSAEVLAAAACFALSAGVTGASATSAQQPPAMALLAGWPVFALAGGVVLDQRPGSRTGRVLAALSLVPLLVTGWAVVRAGGLPSSPDVVRAAGESAALQAVAVALAIPWSVRGRRRATAPAFGRIAAMAAVVGALVVPVASAVWVGVVVGCVGWWAVVLAGARAEERAERRRAVWAVVAVAVGGAAVAGGWLVAYAEVAFYVTATVLVLTALGVARLRLAADFRPLDEYLLDLALVVGVVVAAALTGGLVRAAAGVVGLRQAGTSALFTALTTAAIAVPAGLWVRRTALARRYGSGIIAPDDVAAITAGLHARTEPRALLDEAARMVVAAGGGTQARMVLGAEAPAAPDRWIPYPLEVGGDRVGVLLVEYHGVEGPERRQRTAVARMLPTVALVARAVSLAVEAEHARRDVARERDAERRRVLGDLHDGLGPMLAGMSMQVRAALRAAPPPPYAELLTELAAGLAAGRTDLRRIVAGITPSVLDDHDLPTALDLLVSSFRRAGGGPRLSLEVAVDRTLAPGVQVAVYRSVAEGVTNALRHAAASAIDVRVRTCDAAVEVEVLDDGAGGPIAPGVGLSSLAQRAGSLGGGCEVAAVAPRGTRLRVELPA